MNRRSGATLLEVLISIFICAIGLISLMALFPLGASIMANADRNSRISYVGANALAIGQAQRVGQDSSVTPYLGADPNTYFTSLVPPFPNVVALPGGAGMPVFADPYGYLLGYASTMGNFKLGIPRSSVSYVNTLAGSTDLVRLRRWFTLQDTMQFSNNGDPTEQNTTLGVANDTTAIDRTLQRDTRYSWAYLLRRPSRGLANVVEMSVVVYERRLPSLSGGGETTYANITFDVASNLVRVVPGTGQSKPNVKAGGYILDGTLIRDPATNRIFEPHGFFYQVVNVTDEPDQLTYPNAVILELASKPRMSSYSIVNNTPAPYGVLVVLDGVTEVLERGPIR